MKASSSLALIAWACRMTGTVAPSPNLYNTDTFHTSEAVVLEEFDVWEEGQSTRFHNNRCEVRLQKDGNFLVKRLVAPNPYYQQYRTAWSTGATSSSSDGTFRAQLDGKDGSKDGSLLVIRRNNGGEETTVFSSNIGEPQELAGIDLELATHQLVIDEECVLKIYRDDQLAWTNNRFGGLTGEPGLGDYLQKGEMFHVNQCFGSCDDTQDSCIWSPQVLVLQHDCNLVQFNGRDWADWEDGKGAVWSSKTPRGDLKDCYLYSDKDKVRLYEGTMDKDLPQFAPRNDASYWEADSDFMNPCGGGYEVLLKVKGGLEPSC